MAFDATYLLEVEAKIRLNITAAQRLEITDGDGQSVKYLKEKLKELQDHYEWVKGQIQADVRTSRGFTKFEFKGKS